MSAIHDNQPDHAAESVSSDPSAFSFCRLTSSSSLHHLQRSAAHDFGVRAPARDLKLGVAGGGFSRDAKRQSYPLPLPPSAFPPYSAAKSPSRDEGRAQNVWKKGSSIYRGKLDVYCGFNRNENSTKRDLKIEVRESWTKIDAKQQSYRLPLPPGAIKSSSEIPGTPWKKGRFLGRGVLGGVYLGFNSENGGMCAMKEVPLSCEESRARMKENEILLLSRMRHPNIVEYYGSQMVADNFCLYFELMSRGSIYMILEQYGRLEEAVICSYTQQILSGLAYLHSKSTAHGGIKGANILIDPIGRVKLTNFGIEKQIAKKLRISWGMDNLYWMAPEVIMNPDERNFAVDIWSLGCTILEMATAKPPLSQYDGVVSMSRIAYHKELPTIPDHLSAVCKDFLRHCLQWDPLRRATASQLLDHPYLKGLSPLVDKMLVSSPLGRPAVAKAVKSQSSDHARNLHRLDSGRLVSSSSKSTPHTASNSSTPIRAIQLPHLNQPMTHQEFFRDFSEQSPNSNSPSYWDPNILRGMFKIVESQLPNF